MDVNVLAMHHNPIYWGNDHDKFNPDNFSPEKEAKRHPYAYCPFGYGPRACIGREFALLEARIILAQIVYRLEFNLSPNSKPKVVQQAALRPQNLFLRFFKREHPGSLKGVVLASDLEHAKPKVSATEVTEKKDEEEMVHTEPFKGTQLPTAYILFGSNMGTCRDLAAELGAELKQSLGFIVVVKELDQIVESEMKDVELAIILSSTYNGLPPDNALDFQAWLSSVSTLDRLRFSVFGVGNTQWRSFQAFPKQVNNLLFEKQAKRILARGVGNVDAGGEMEKSFDAWKDQLVANLKRIFGSLVAERQDTAEDTAIPFDIALEKAAVRIPSLREGALQLKISEHFNLQNASSGRKTIHLEVDLEPGQSYETGDHFGIYPQNSDNLVKEVLHCIQFPDNLSSATDVFSLRTKEGFQIANLSFLVGKPVSVIILLQHVFDLHSPPTRLLLKQLLKYCTNEKDADRLLSLSKDLYAAQVLNVRQGLTSIMNQLPSLKIPLSDFINCMPLIQPRLYSIASSNVVHPSKVHLAISIVDGPSKDLAIRKENYVGFASGTVLRLCKGESIVAFPKHHGSRFYLPSDSSIPIVMVGSGTGVAPFRGFLQHRQWQRSKGETLGPAILVFGCRNSELDELYGVEFRKMKVDGILTHYFVAYSRPTNGEKTYVQDRLLHPEVESAVWQQIHGKRGYFFVCGDANGMAKGVLSSMIKIASKTLFNGDQTKGQTYINSLVDDYRYLEDIWG